MCVLKVRFRIQKRIPFHRQFVSAWMYTIACPRNVIVFVLFWFICLSAAEIKRKDSISSCIEILMHALRFIHVYIHVIHGRNPRTRNISASGEVYRAHY